MKPLIFSAYLMPTCILVNRHLQCRHLQKIIISDTHSLQASLARWQQIDKIRQCLIFFRVNFLKSFPTVESSCLLTNFVSCNTCIPTTSAERNLLFSAIHSYPWPATKGKITLWLKIVFIIIIIIILGLKYSIGVSIAISQGFLSFLNGLFLLRVLLSPYPIPIAFLIEKQAFCNDCILLSSS